MLGVILATLYACLMHYLIGRRMYHEEMFVVFLPTFYLVYGCGYSWDDVSVLTLPEALVVSMAVQYTIVKERSMAQDRGAKDNWDATDLGWFHAQDFLDLVFHRTGAAAAWHRAHQFVRVRLLTRA